MELDLDVAPLDLQGDGFFELDSPNNFDFDVLPMDQYELDDLGLVKQESLASDETIFDSPSASPLRVDAKLDPVSSPYVSDDLGAEDVLMTDVAPFPGLHEDQGSLELEVDANSAHDGSSSAEVRDSDSDSAKKRGRKRKASPVAHVPQEKRARVKVDGRVLSKEELATLSSEELEEYATAIQNSNLSAGEKNEIRKQLRLVKNRESAQASRLRKKTYIDDLEKKVNLLQAENTVLRSKTKEMHDQNAQLKTEVVYLKGVVSKGGLSKVFEQGATFFNKLSQQQVQQQQAGKAGTMSARTTGVVLMVVLFSFGLLFNSHQMVNPATPIAIKSAVHEANGRILTHAQYKPTSEQRDVLSILDKSEMPTQRIRQIVEKQRAMPNAATHKLGEPVAKTIAVPELQASLTREELLVPEWKANTTYLLCPQVHKLNPPAELQAAPKEGVPQHIAFLVPPSALGAEADDKVMLEVTCQVVDVTTRAYPRQVADMPS